MEESRAAVEQMKPSGIGPEVFPLLVADIEARRAKGIATYGEPLRAWNGRSSLLDAYQEALDLAAYLRQVLAEQDEEASARLVQQLTAGLAEAQHDALLSAQAAATLRQQVAVLEEQLRIARAALALSQKIHSAYILPGYDDTVLEFADAMTAAGFPLGPMPYAEITVEIMTTSSSSSSSSSATEEQ